MLLCTTMSTPDLPPPRGPRQFLGDTTRSLSTLKQGRVAQWVRDNAMLVAAVVLLMFVGLLSLLGQTNTINPNDPTYTPVIEPSEIPPTIDPVDAALTGTPVPLMTPEPAQQTPIGPIVGPNPVTPTTDRAGGGRPTEDPEATFDVPQPYPGDDGGLFPTFPTDDDVFEPQPNPTPFPTFAPPSTGFPPARATATAGPLPTLPVVNDDPFDDDDEPIDPYPVDDEATPTLIPTFPPINDDDDLPPTNIPPSDETEEPGDPEQTEEPGASSTPAVSPTPTLTPSPTATATPSVDLLTGTTRWGVAQSPVYVRRETVVASGASLIIEPGVEVQIAPDASLVVNGSLLADGAPGSLIRFRKTARGGWNSIVVNPGAVARLNRVDIQGGGNGGVIIAALGGDTIISDSFIDSQGSVLGAGGNLDMQRTILIAPAPLSVEVPSGGWLRLLNNSVTSTSLDGATAVNIVARTSDTELTVEGNFVSNESGTNMQARLERLTTASIQCNTLRGGAVGLSIKTNNPNLDTSLLIIKLNSLLYHDVYGITSDVLIDGRNNWWGDPSGPYETEVNASGTGDAVGINVPFQPWLTAKPACSP